MGHLNFLDTTPSLPFLSLFITILVASQIPLGCTREAHSSNFTCIESERQSLLRFKDSLTDESNRLSSWTGGDCCSWKGIGCHRTTGRVVKLDLRNLEQPELYEASDPSYHCRSCLAGDQLSPSLVNLTKLQYLDVSVNNFSGIRIPTFLGLLKDLRYLNLSDAGFVGEVPRHLGNLSHLRYLDIGFSSSNYIPIDNNLTSNDVGWVAKLSSLEYLSLRGVNLSNARDGFLAVSMLASLKTLDLEYCELVVPHLSQVNFTSLSSLQLRFNQFLNPTLPPWLRNLTSLQGLGLFSNNLDDKVHDTFRQMTSLVNLDLGRNHFDTSTLRSICNISSLTGLYMSENQLQGSIPSEIGQFPQLTQLDLSNNRLNDTIPSSLWQLTKLQELYIAANALTGELSEHHFAKLRELKILDVSDNLFSLHVSSSWVPPFQLQYIWMASVKIGPRFPNWLRTQKEIEALNMYNASISDAIPGWFGVLSNDTRGLILSGNKLEGSLNSVISAAGVDKKVLQMRYLHLNHNHFTGSIPEDLCKLKTLIYLDLSNNHLSGRIPLCLGNLRYLRILHLGSNSLYGQIPGSLGNLGELISLQLSKNRFDGKLPPSMQNLKRLRFLDLGENRIADTIPAWIGERSSHLEFLTLQSNNFHGGISNTLCQLPYLQVLNLEHNDLSGSIPHCFKNFTAMESTEPGTFPYSNNSFVDPVLRNFKAGIELEYSKTIDSVKSISLSGNNLVGEIPDEIMGLVGLQTLNLSKNHLNGRIPKNIGNLKQLETLDLSMNELRGEIPPSLSSIYSLSSLNLSYNKLSGPIPSGNQLQTLNDPSIYEGNIGLCGKPLLNSCPAGESPTENGPVLDDKGHSESDFSWFYAGFGPGFSVGVVGVVGILQFKQSWRYALFKCVENAYDRIWVMIGLKTSRLRRNFH
ncbi:receptor-like protein EIX2 isoform X1 [Coffea eugenioides]|uniref:receptor-like protein EIX2 isoform X1 n=1 Tax=Coffea eugenioides TaxID=49369 RepID=UPI000F60BB68|nr:receptor-like protein EIX2 isoform X1 [Coffea eugenioides]